MLSSPSSPIILRTDESGNIKLKKKLFKTKLLFRSRQSIGKKSKHSLCVKRTQKAIFSNRDGKWKFYGEKVARHCRRWNRGKACAEISHWASEGDDCRRKRGKSAIKTQSFFRSVAVRRILFVWWFFPSAMKRSTPSTTTNYVTYLLHVWVGELLQRWAWLKIDRECQNFELACGKGKKGQANLSRITFTFD